MNDEQETSVLSTFLVFSVVGLRLTKCPAQVHAPTSSSNVDSTALLWVPSRPTTRPKRLDGERIDNLNVLLSRYARVANLPWRPIIFSGAAIVAMLVAALFFRSQDFDVGDSTALLVIGGILIVSVFTAGLFMLLSTWLLQLVLAAVRLPFYWKILRGAPEIVIDGTWLRPIYEMERRNLLKQRREAKDEVIKKLAGTGAEALLKVVTTDAFAKICGVATEKLVSELCASYRRADDESSPQSVASGAESEHGDAGRP